MNKLILNIYSGITDEQLHSFDIQTTLDPKSDNFTEDFEMDILEDVFDRLMICSSKVYYEVI